jgi:hypothetical protein
VPADYPARGDRLLAVFHHFLEQFGEQLRVDPTLVSGKPERSLAFAADAVAHGTRHGAQTSLVDVQAFRVVGFTFQLMEEQQGRRSTVSGNRSAFPARTD